MTDPSCVFCKIVAGQIPCHRVYEDGEVLAFLDIGPLADGHLLVVPKGHYGRLEEMPPEVLGRLAATFPRLARAVLQATGAAGYNLLQNNGGVAQQEVPHVHFHIIPRAAGDGLGYRWIKSADASQRVDVMRGRLLEALQQPS